MTYKELASDLGCSTRTLKRIRAALGIEPRVVEGCGRSLFEFTPRQVARIRREHAARQQRAFGLAAKGAR